MSFRSKNKSFDQKLLRMKLEERTFGTPCITAKSLLRKFVFSLLEINILSVYRTEHDRKTEWNTTLKL